MGFMELPLPTIKLVKEKCAEYDNAPWNKLGDLALAQLLGKFRENTEDSHVLLKVLVLNKLFSSWVPDIKVEPLAVYIAGCGIDPLLKDGTSGAVKLITDCPEMKRRHYSFATKFCSWHEPTKYPIYDRYADACLWLYQKQRAFSKNFHHQDLEGYDGLIRIITAFGTFFELKLNDDVTYRELDKFLWLLGGEIIKEKEHLKSQKKKGPSSG
jgi:hypothetical protein